MCWMRVSMSWRRWRSSREDFVCFAWAGADQAEEKARIEHALRRSFWVVHFQRAYTPIAVFRLIKCGMGLGR